MVQSKTFGKFRRAGGTVLKVLFPFSAMRQTAELAQREAERTRSNLVVLKRLGRDARDAIAGPRSSEAVDETFDEAMRRRRPDAMSAADLRKHFLLRKRIAIFAAAFFFLTALGQAVLGIWMDSVRAVVLAALCGLSFQPMFFVITLGAQLRIWQLDTRRLSSSEHGGIKDFMRECPSWWLITLDPELRRGPKDQA